MAPLSPRLLVSNIQVLTVRSLATIACHRAVMYNRHKGLGPWVPRNSDNITDNDYKRACHDMMMATKVKEDNQEVTDSDFLEACFGIISTTTIVGDFQEARKYLIRVRNLLDRVEVPATAEAWLPLADIKAALGLLDKPRVAIPWERVTVGDGKIGHMLPLPGSRLSHLGASFTGVKGLSHPLHVHLRDAAAICHMCDFNVRDVDGLMEHEHVMFRCKSLELEYDLLKYVYDEFPNQEVPPTEDIVRLAILGILSTISVYVLPGCGLGRAITQHQLKAIERVVCE